MNKAKFIKTANRMRSFSREKGRPFSLSAYVGRTWVSMHGDDTHIQALSVAGRLDVSFEGGKVAAWILFLEENLPDE